MSWIQQPKLVVSPSPLIEDEYYEHEGVKEVACTYQSFEEREANRPRRIAVPNPELDEDMEKYKLKIDARFKESKTQMSYKFPRVGK